MGGGAPPPLPSPMGGGGMGGPPPGAPGGSQTSKKLKAYSVWDTLEKLVKGEKTGSDSKPDDKGQAPVQPDAKEPPQAPQG